MGIIKNIDEIKVSCADIWLEGDGILRIIYAHNIKVSLIEAKEVGLAITSASKGRPHPVYADMRGVKSMTREARAHFSSDEVSQWTTAIATNDTLISKVIIELYIKLNKPPYPMKYFSSELESIEWLKMLLE